MVSLPVFRYLGYGTLVSLQVFWELIKPSDGFEIIQGLRVTHGFLSSLEVL